MTGGFPASHRLKIKAQFDWVFSRPNDRCSHGVLQAIYKPANAEHTRQPSIHRRSGTSEPEIAPEMASISPLGPRLGLIIAKRFLPRAVDRNRLKRLIREGFRAQRAELPDADIIVRLVRRPAREVSAGEVAVLFGKMQRSQPPASHTSQSTNP